MEERSKVVELKEPSAREAPQRQRVWTAEGCRNEINRERDVVWTLAGVMRLLAAQDSDSQEFQEFYFPGLAFILDGCGGHLAEVGDELGAVEKHLDGLGMG